ncbi:MAG: FkbM family methyltransferase [Nitrososphaerota archaeon]
MRLFEQTLRKVFNVCGFVIYRKGRRRTTLGEIVDHVLKLGFRPRTVIDVGVAYGTFELYRFPDAKYILIEPLREFEPFLKKICKKYDAEYVLAAASDHPGIIEIKVHNNLTSSSIFEETSGVFKGFSRKVPAVTIDDVCKERKLKGPYVIKIDVQGAELKVLDGAKNVLKDAELVILEVSLFQFYVGGPQFYDVITYMKEHGFVVYDFYNGHNRPFDGALAQIDVVFVKENGPFRKYHIYRRLVNG